MTYKKKLIEVALPLEAINVACKNDKARKTGTIRNLHKWFAPMPIPAWRALITAALLDDPDDPDERATLLALLESLVASDAKPPPKAVLDEVRRRIRADVGDLPVVFDPFCGGGSTLVEAQRLGLPICGSDLNPIPVLITRVLTTLLPPLIASPALVGQLGGRLADIGTNLDGIVSDVSHYAKRIYIEAERKIGDIFPVGLNGDPVIAWWWARTIASPDPRYKGAHTPLVNDWWLSKRKGHEAYVSPIVDREQGTVKFAIVDAKGGAPPSSKSRCLFSEAPIPFKYIKEEGLKNALSSVLIATITHGQHGRQHSAPTAEQIYIADSVRAKDPPRVELPPKALGFTVQQYGITKWSQLFTERQMVALETFADLVAEVPGWVSAEGGSDDYATAVTTVLGLCIGKLAQANSMQVRWRLDSRTGQRRQSLPSLGQTSPHFGIS